NLLLLIGSIMAERFLYLPSVGFAGCVVAAVLALIERLIERFPAPRGRLVQAGGFMVLVAVGGGLGLRTHLRNLDWTDNERLWSSAVETSPASFKTHLVRAEQQANRGGGLDELYLTIAEAEKSIAVLTDLPPGKISNTPSFGLLGMLYRMLGDAL